MQVSGCYIDNSEARNSGVHCRIKELTNTYSARAMRSTVYDSSMLPGLTKHALACTKAVGCYHAVVHKAVHESQLTLYIRGLIIQLYSVRVCVEG